MIKFSEFVSLGHPDKIADYISSRLLDEYLKKDQKVRYAVEVQIKGQVVNLAGEVTSSVNFTEEELTNIVRKAVCEIGYTSEYAEFWGTKNTINGEKMIVNSFISQQSTDIALGVNNDGWGDQGIFFGYASPNSNYYYMPEDHSLAKRLCKNLYDSGIGGLDIKTQVVMDDDEIRQVVVAIPLLYDNNISKIKDYIRDNINGDYELIINGTGRYIQHSTIADCGTTGRKLAVDFYGGNCKIGGGSPWTKDGSKADLSLNLLARNIALQYVERERYPHELFVKLCCRIGSPIVECVVTDCKSIMLESGTHEVFPYKLINEFELNKPIFSSMCKWGLFGEYQSDKKWEIIN